MKSNKLLQTIKYILLIPVLVLAFICTSVNHSLAQTDILLNGSFETGAHGPEWIVNTTIGPFCTAPAVVTNGASCFGGLFTTSATDGGFVSHDGFDGSGPGIMEICQVVSIPQSSSVMLEWDARFGWNYGLGGAATIPRTHAAVVRPFIGGAALQTDVVFTAPTAVTLNPDTGPLSFTSNLIGFSGMTVQVCLTNNIPQGFTGPGHSQVDNVRLLVVEANLVPTMSEWGLILLVLLTLTFGAVFMTARNRQLAGAGGNMTVGSTFRNLPFNASTYGRILMITFGVVVLGFAVAIFAFGYSLTNADIPGVLICAPVLAYLVYLLKGGAPE